MDEKPRLSICCLQKHTVGRVKDIYGLKVRMEKNIKCKWKLKQHWDSYVSDQTDFKSEICNRRQKKSITY